jgi:hypothetical protein
MERRILVERKVRAHPIADAGEMQSRLREPHAI